MGPRVALRRLASTTLRIFYAKTKVEKSKPETCMIYAFKTHAKMISSGDEYLNIISYTGTAISEAQDNKHMFDISYTKNKANGRKYLGRCLKIAKNHRFIIKTLLQAFSVRYFISTQRFDIFESSRCVI